MNIQQLEYVLAVKELGNFSAAADKCNITQSTLSTMIGKLEDQIGIQIFDRKTKPVSITKEGEVLIRQMKIVSFEMEQFKETVQLLKGDFVGHVSIGVIPTVAPYLLPGFLNEFAHQFPKMEFTVSEMTTGQIIDSLKRRDLDLGILATPINVNEISEIPLYNESFLLFDCTDVSYPKDIVSISEINFDNLWLMEEGHCLSAQVLNICDFKLGKSSTHNFNFGAGSIDSLIRFVKRNKGLTLLPELATLEFSAKEKARLFQLQAPVPVRRIGIVTHEHFVKRDLLKKMQEQIQLKIKLTLQQNKSESVIFPMI
ncbi:MAG: LysR substrate-binding domain-containing protein [Bacteroidia bacterium]